jgi:hypothetical protein
MIVAICSFVNLYFESLLLLDWPIPQVSKEVWNLLQHGSPLYLCNFR